MPMNPTPTNDTGIPGLQDTMVSDPSFIGQVYAPFPGTVANLPVYVQFSGLHDGVGRRDGHYSTRSGLAWLQLSFRASS